MSVFKQTRATGKGMGNITQQQAYEIEKQCLTILEKNYECTCGMNARHFPIILSCDDNSCKLELTDCGIEVGGRVDGSNIHLINEVRNYREQVECIVQNLKKNRVQHLDIHPLTDLGRNVCVKNGILSLIDFDLASLGDDFLTQELELRYNDMILQSKDYYDSIRQHLMNLEAE